MTSVASLVLFATDLAATTAFYRALGVPLDDEDHGDGPLHGAVELGEVHVAVYQAEEGLGDRATALRSAASVFPGFSVASLDEATDRLAALGAATVEPHQVRPWGCRVIVEDPDGRAVEINQRRHCV